MAGDHLYTTDADGELAPEAGYELEGIACHVFVTQVANTQAFHRWFHPHNGDHFYTLDPNGEAAPQGGYNYEGVACYVYPSPQAGTVPLNRWYNGSSGDHFYTTDPSGELAPTSGYVHEGVACHVGPALAAGFVPFFRWFQNGLMANFTFDPAIPRADRLRVMQRHSFAHFRARQCTTNLSVQERADALRAYQKPIWHGISTDPTANASATVGGTQIWINFANLFPQGNQEIAQTLLHEMMHIAGHRHPNRRDPPAGMTCANPNPALFDCPFDNGPYYGTPPLRAELCIAGSQSDAVRARDKAATERCVIDDSGIATIRAI